MNRRQPLEHALRSLTAQERADLLGFLMADLDDRPPAAGSADFDRAHRALPRRTRLAPPPPAAMTNLSPNVFRQLDGLHQQASAGVQQLRRGPPAIAAPPQAPRPAPVAKRGRGRRRLLAILLAAVVVSAAWLVFAGWPAVSARIKLHRARAAEPERAAAIATLRADIVALEKRQQYLRPQADAPRKADEQLSDIESQVETLRQQKDRQAKEEKRLRGLPDELKQAQAERAAHQTELAALDRQRADLTARRDTLTRELVKNFVAARTGQEWEDNGLQMKFCWCPPGTFTMGSPASEAGYDSDEDQVSVTISNGLWMGKYEVLQGEYRTVMGNTPSHFSSSDRRPVETVSYTEATEFCRKFTEQERRAGRLPADWEYRLPTEAEWEYACRAGTTTRFCCGDSEGELENYAWFSSNSGSTTHPVGEKQSNAWGLHDMHGNVWEWCQDWYQDKLPGGGDPVGPQSASVRVTRGGSWYVAAANCRSAYRRRYSPEFRLYSLGFRVAAVRSPR